MSLRNLCAVIAAIITALISTAELKSQTNAPPFIKYMNHPWVDSVMKTLTIDKQIAQCIWVAGFSDRDVEHEVEISDLIRKSGIGGIIFFKGTPEKQAELSNYFQKISSVPLLMAMDGEWGIGMRLGNVEKYPFQMTIGAIKDDSLVYQFGKAVASQFKRMGMQINLAPVADINNNPLNPVINYRSFGEKKDNVALKCLLYMKGMQDNGILATGKHFPGHGDTNVDSHFDLPLITHSKLRLDTLELYPFRKLISEGIGSIMTAHLSLPSLDTTKALPSSLSPVIIKGLLKNELGFTGLIITDAMNMQGVTEYLKPGDAVAKALGAGNDVVAYVTDVEEAIESTKNYILAKKLTDEDIALKCRKILALKYWSGLNKAQYIVRENIEKELSPMTSKALIRDLYANSLTVLTNKQDILPLKNLQSIKIATVAINRSGLSLFQQSISKYHPSDHFFLDPSNTSECANLLKKLSGYDIVITGIFGLDQRPNTGYGIKPALIDFLNKLSGSNNTIITWFGNPYAVNNIKTLQNANGLILTYQENDYTEDLSAQLIFGGIGAHGSLPVTINENWPVDFGIETPADFRLQYGIPESAGMSSEILNRKIDSLVNTGLKVKAFPGCEVMVARKGIVVFRKSYGYQTYDNRISVLEDDLYDLASVTKITATLPGLMLLDTEGKFSPDKDIRKLSSRF